MSRFPIRSLSKPSTQVMYLVGAVLCGFIGYKVGIEALQKQTTNIFDWIIGTGAIIATVIFLLAPCWYYRILVHHDYMELSQFAGLRKKIIWRKDLLSYDLVKRQSKYGTWYVWYVLKLYTADDQHTIDSQQYANFQELQQELTAPLPRTFIEEKRARDRDERMEPIFIALFWAIVIPVLWIFGNRGYNYAVDEAGLVQCTATLREKPVIVKNTGRNHSRYLSLSLTEQPDLDFDIAGSGYDAMHSREFVQHHNAGDTIILRISRSEFETKITREKPPRFWEKYFCGQNRIEIYELTSRDNRGYLTIPDYEQAYRADYKFDFWLLVLITIVVVFCYQWAKKQDRLDGLRR